MGLQKVVWVVIARGRAVVGVMQRGVLNSMLCCVSTCEQTMFCCVGMAHVTNMV